MTTPARKLLTPQMRRRLVSARVAKGISQKDLAADIGISNVQLCQAEKGNCQPSIDILGRWCYELGLELRVEIK